MAFLIKAAKRVKKTENKISSGKDGNYGELLKCKI